MRRPCPPSDRPDWTELAVGLWRLLVALGVSIGVVGRDVFDRRLKLNLREERMRSVQCRDINMFIESGHFHFKVFLAHNTTIFPD